MYRGLGDYTCCEQVSVCRPMYRGLYRGLGLYLVTGIKSKKRVHALACFSVSRKTLKIVSLQ